MEYLRLILLIAGLLLIGGIYVWGRAQRKRREARRRPDLEIPLDDDLEPIVGAGSSVPAADDELEQELESLGHMVGSRGPAPVVTAQAPEQEIPPVVASVAPEAEGETVELELGPAEPEEPDETPEKVVALFITAPKGSAFTGSAVLAAARAHGFEHGAMRIFHHRVAGGGVFSMASATEPGYFEPEKMDDAASFKGLALFMPLPGSGDGLKTFDALIAAASGMAERLGGDLRDESRSVLTRQTSGHLREEVAEWLLHHDLERRSAHKGKKRR